MIKRILILLLCINIFVASAGASLFPWIKPAPAQASNFETFYSNTIQPLNTQANTKTMTAYMDSYGVKSIKVHVTDYNRNFYVLKGQSTALTGTGADKSISLTSEQVKSISSMLADSDLSYFEKVQIYLILRGAYA